MHERWVPLQDYPGFVISNLGVIYNQESQKKVSASRATGGNLRVNLRNENGEFETRSLARLVALTFVSIPFPDFDTVVQLDGSHNNVAASNLVWRPRWFALEYRGQFESPGILFHRDRYAVGPIRNGMTGKVYSSVAEAAINEGALAENILEALKFGEAIWPFNFYYEEV
jgi:hypothetical protein